MSHHHPRSHPTSHHRGGERTEYKKIDLCFCNEKIYICITTTRHSRDVTRVGFEAVLSQSVKEKSRAHIYRERAYREYTTLFMYYISAAIFFFDALFTAERDREI